MPVLVISGRDDIRTPLESARRIAAGYPHATFLEVNAVGHSVIRHDYSGCALKGMIAFLRAQPVASCAAVQPFIAPAIYRPAQLPGAAARSTPSITRSRRRSATARPTAAGTTCGRASDCPGCAAASRSSPRAGSSSTRTQTILGVRVSGKLSAARRGTVTVSGPRAAAGTVTFRRSRVSGTLGGKRVR